MSEQMEVTEIKWGEKRKRDKEKETDEDKEKYKPQNFTGVASVYQKMKPFIVIERMRDS